MSLHLAQSVHDGFGDPAEACSDPAEPYQKKRFSVDKRSLNIELSGLLEKTAF